MGRQDAGNSRQAERVLRCIDRLSACVAMERRLARHALQEVEEAMELQQSETGRSSSGACQPGENCAQRELPAQIETQLEELNRRLVAANSELRRYETRVFAYERAMMALKEENAQLADLCHQAREGQPLPPEPAPQSPVLDQPGLPVISFTPEGTRQEETVDDEAAPFFDEGRPPRPMAGWKPKTKLDKLSVELLAQFDRMLKD